ncbi:hypothetical protein RIF29_14448 [Crotalaria pallida]|uniref:Uncharacterized protein n=1 Tax=Crotalaria pallida TaxID=3830 RepID=A0AAN9ICR7_CROPI
MKQLVVEGLDSWGLAAAVSRWFRVGAAAVRCVVATKKVRLAGTVLWALCCAEKKEVEGKSRRKRRRRRKRSKKEGTELSGRAGKPGSNRFELGLLRAGLKRNNLVRVRALK